MKKKKIGLVLTSCPQLGGEFQYEVLLANTVIKYFKNNIEIIVFCYNSFWIRWCKSNHIRYIKHNWNHYSLEEVKFALKHPIFNAVYCCCITNIGQILHKENIKLLICGQQGTYIPNYPIKVLRPVHDLMHRYESDFPEIKSSIEGRELQFQSVAKFANTILVDSKLGKKQFTESYLKYQWKKPKIKILPYIVPKHIYEVKEEYIYTPKKYLFYPAQFWEHKNHINLLKAINFLISDIPDIHLILAGSEKNSMRTVKEYIKENKLESYVTICGFVTDEQITYLYKHSVGLVMPTYFGPTNIPPLEAMALGCPTIVSDKYAMREQVGDAALYFNPDLPEEIADCIKKIWYDKILRKEMIEKGYQRIKKWGKKEFEGELIKIIKGLI